MRISDWSSDVCSSDLVGDHVRVAPDLRIHRVAGMEHAGDRPDLAAQTDLIADIEPGELALRAGADHDFALAGGEALAFDDLPVRAHRPGLRADRKSAG